MRAEVPNPDGSILPGQYIKATLTIGKYVDAIVVPEQAVLEGQEGPHVFVVDAANKVAASRSTRSTITRACECSNPGSKPGRR